MYPFFVTFCSECTYKIVINQLNIKVMDKSKKYIDKIILNTLTGGLLITTFKSKREISIHKDNDGYFFYLSKKMGVIQRIENRSEIKRINDFIGIYM